MEKTKLKLLRVLDILSETDECHPLTSTQICQKLSLYGIEAERKSISRDINLLMEYGCDIIPCADKRLGYFMASHKFENWELKILIDAVSGAKFLTKAATQAISDKLTSLTSEDSRKLLKQSTPVVTEYKTKNVTVKNGIDVILKAIRTKQKVSFQYVCVDANLSPKLKRDGYLYTVSPYKLLWENQFYYLICNTDSHDNLSYYRLDRIKSIAIQPLPVRQAKEIVGDNPDLAINDYIARSLYHYGGERIHLTLRVQNSLIEKLIDHFGNNFQIQAGELYSTISITINESAGLYFWLLQYGEQLEILAPQSVRDSYLSKLRNILLCYDSPFEVLE